MEKKDYKRYSVNVAFSISEIYKYIVTHYDLDTDDMIPISHVLHDKHIDFNMSEFDSGDKEYTRFHLDIVTNGVYDFLIENFFFVKGQDVRLVYDIKQYSSFFVGTSGHRYMLIDIVFETQKAHNHFKLTNSEMYQEIVNLNNKMLRVGN
jgi:hypothetical protein